MKTRMLFVALVISLSTTYLSVQKLNEPDLGKINWDAINKDIIERESKEQYLKAVNVIIEGKENHEENLRIKAEEERIAKEEAERKAKKEQLAKEVAEKKAKEAENAKANSSSNTVYVNNKAAVNNVTTDSIIAGMPAVLKIGHKHTKVDSSIVNLGFIGAFRDSTPDTIYVSSSKYLNYTGLLYHEMAHLFAYRTRVVHTDRWQKIYQAEWVGSGLYGATKPGEAFAESVSIYYTGEKSRGSLANRPQSKQFVEEVMGIKPASNDIKDTVNRPAPPVEKPKDSFGGETIPTKLTVKKALADGVIYDKIKGTAVGIIPAGSEYTVAGRYSIPLKHTNNNSYYWEYVKYGDKFYWIEPISGIFK